MKIQIFAIFSILAAGCATVNFNINEVNFSSENTSKNILPLEYHDRSNLNSEIAEKIMSGTFAPDSNIWGYYYIKKRITL